MADLLNNPNSGNGMITKIWGPGLWMGAHSISFGYPMEPTDEQKHWYMNWFSGLQHVLPCRYCRDSYKHFITSEPTILNMDVMKNRETLTKWLYDVHQRVNAKLGVDYHVTYEDVVRRYESYRAKCNKSKENEKAKGCVVPSDISLRPYLVAESRDCPTISKRLANAFINYAHKRGIEKEAFRYLDLPIEELDFLDEKMVERNNYCREIITTMRCHDIPSKEYEGEFIGFPTIDETKLLLARCSMLNRDEVIDMARKLGGIRVRYKFTQ